MQKVGAQYLMKKFADQVLAAPDEPAETDAQVAAQSASPPRPAAETMIVNGDQGEPIGTAYRVESLAVYVVSDGLGDPAIDLERCLSHAQTRRFLQFEDGRLSAMIFVPDPSHLPRAPRATASRADEI